jgi:hypothetical protein
MNIFYLDKDPQICAQMHNDKHVVKMILEYAQLLSTAHRVLDGFPQRLCRENSGRQYTGYSLPDHRDAVLYSATHINHPSAVWVRQSSQNYYWLFALWCHLMDEYTFRYGKVHATKRLYDDLYHYPKNIPLGIFTEPTPAMPDDVKIAGDVRASYRNYYNVSKRNLASWKGKINSRPTPEWYNV